MNDSTIDPQGLRRRTWLLGVANTSIGLQGIAMYLLSTEWFFLALGILFLLLIPVAVIDRPENRSAFSVITDWLIALSGSLCFLKISIAGFIIVLSCNLVLLAVCIAILYKPWLWWKQRQKQRKRELRREQRMEKYKRNRLVK